MNIVALAVILYNRASDLERAVRSRRPVDAARLADALTVRVGDFFVDEPPSDGQRQAAS